MAKDRPAYKVQPAPRRVSTGSVSKPRPAATGRPSFQAIPVTRRTKAPL